MLIAPHALFVAAVVGIVLGSLLTVVGLWWTLLDIFVGSRQKRQFDRVKDARAVSCQVSGLRPVFMGRVRSFRGAQLAYIKVQKEGETIQVKRPLILGRNWEAPKETLQRVSVGARLDLLEDDLGVVALRVD